MRPALIALGAIAVVFACIALGALWFVSWPMRLAARACGLERKRGPSKGLIAVATESTLALVLSYFGLRRSGKAIGPAWHPCENCGAPIDKPSRASYCSQACRRDANIRARAALEGVAHYE